MNFDLMHPRDQITLIMERIYRTGMTTTSGGNLSILDEDGVMWITPAGTDKGRLQPEDIVQVLPGGRIEGRHRPSSEYPFHLAVYEARPDVRSVLHAHPPALVSFSILNRIPDTRVVPKAAAICGDVGFAPYALPGSEALGRTIAETFAKGFKTVLLENHGIVTVGSSLFNAFRRFETLDFCARLILKASLLGQVRPLKADQLRLFDHKENYLLEYPVTHHDSREKHLRRVICDMVHRAYDQGLITSLEGTASCRLGGNDFLITPFGIDRSLLQPEDLIVIRDGRREAGRIPSRSVHLHMRLYQDHPDLGAILIAHPTHVMAFGISGVPLDSRVIPESYVVLRDIAVLPYGPQFTDPAKVSGTISAQCPNLMVENDCLITTGRNLLEAFDRLEVAEFSAQALINAKPLGAVQPPSCARPST